MKENWTPSKTRGTVITDKMPEYKFRPAFKGEKETFGGYVIANDVPNGLAMKTICLASRMVEVCKSIYKDDVMFENLRPSDRKALKELIREIDPNLVDESEV